MLTARELTGLGIQRMLDEDGAMMRRQIREASATRTLQVYSDDWLSLLIQRIGTVYKHESTQSEVRKFASTERNLLRRVTDAVSVAYNQPPRRTLAKMGRRSNDALRQVLYEEAGIDVLAEEVARMAFALGVVHVVPTVRPNPHFGDTRLCFDIVLPHAAEALFEPGDRSRPSILVYDIAEDDARRVALDSEGWVYYDEHWKQVRREEHGLGRCPAVQHRVRHNEIDYWDCKPGEKLVAATLEVARISAHKAWIRKCSSSKLATAFSEAISDGSDGPINAEQGFSKAVDPNDIEFTIHDYITPVDQFILEMKDIQEDLAESFGIPVARIDPSNSQPSYTPAEHAAISKIRAGQIKHLARAERELVWTSCQMMERFNHPLSRSLNPEKVKKSYRVDFPLLTFVDDPKTMLEVSNELVKQAQSNPVEEYMARHPEATEEEAHAAIKRNVEIRGEFTKMQAEHGIANDPRNDRDNKAQMEGREGGQISKPPGAEENEE